MTPIDEIWKLVYRSFEGGLQGAWKTVTASNSQRNEMQFKLQKHVSEYKHNPSEAALLQIEADVKICNAVGFITDETAELIQQKIDLLY